MSEIKKIMSDIETVLAESNFPEDFLEAYDQMECLAGHKGRESFLVQRKSDGLQAVAKCYDKQVISRLPDLSLLQSLKGPGIPEYYEKFENSHMLCIIREYVEGTPLNRYVREKQLNRTEILSIADQLCAILEHLHNRKPPLIHRDIKPENIIVRPDQNIVLIDFDISREYKPDAEPDTIIYGTKGYAPPEQYGFKQTDRKADIYAFGILLRWLMTGNIRPNQNITIDPGIQHVIDRCTAFSPEQRYSDIHQVRDELRKASQKQLRISRRTAAGLILTALISLCAGFFAGRFSDIFRSAPPAPEITFTEPLIEAAVRAQLGLDENTKLTSQNLAEVKRIYIYGNQVYGDPDEFFSQDRADHTAGKIHTLNDLIMLPNLEELHIVFQGDINIAALSQLEKLQVVELKHVRLSDVYPLTDLAMLREAVLFATSLKDVSALSACHWLESLDVGNTHITEMKQIGEHFYLRSLCLRGLRMESLDGIEEMTNLRAVTLAQAHIGDLSALTKIPHLERIYVTPKLTEAVNTLFTGTSIEIIEIDN